jgi:hypothetical protein
MLAVGRRDSELPARSLNAGIGHRAAKSQPSSIRCATADDMLDLPVGLPVVAGTGFDTAPAMTIVCDATGRMSLISERPRCAEASWQSWHSCRSALIWIIVTLPSRFSAVRTEQFEHHSCLLPPETVVKRGA